VLIVWVYYSGQIFFLGAEFTKTFANCYGSQPSRAPDGMVTDGVATVKPASRTPNIITPSQLNRVEKQSQDSGQGAIGR